MNAYGFAANVARHNADFRNQNVTIRVTSPWIKLTDAYYPAPVRKGEKVDETS